MALRYVDGHSKVTETYPANPNGSPLGITGLSSQDGRVLLMMPHPERCSEPELGGTDGLKLFRSVIESAARVLAS